MKCSNNQTYCIKICLVLLSETPTAALETEFLNSRSSEFSASALAT